VIGGVGGEEGSQTQRRSLTGKESEGEEKEFHLEKEFGGEKEFHVNRNKSPESHTTFITLRFHDKKPF
jgi:predicted Zn-dependent peptidase